MFFLTVDSKGYTLTANDSLVCTVAYADVIANNGLRASSVRWRTDQWRYTLYGERDMSELTP